MANPDGSFTLTSDRQPVRVMQAGKWAPIDTTLQPLPDGSLSPKATVADLTFSGGGTGPALQIADPATGNQISFSWPTPLPVPSLHGDTATYGDVLPGVDLQLSAQPNSYSEVLVVKDETAAQNPELSQLKLRAEASGLTLAKAPGGGLSATDASGATVFDGTAPAMWDSTTDSKVGPAPTADDPGSAKVVPVPVSVPTTDGTDQPATTTVTLTPPAAALDGPNVTYPVYIDPVLSTPNHVDYAVALSAGASYFDDSTQDMKVGDCTWSDCNGIGVARSYFSFNTAGITRRQSYQVTTAHVFAAEIDVYEIHNAAGCTTEPVDLWTASGISKSTTWPGPYVTKLASVSSNLSDTCSTAQPGIVAFKYNENLNNRLQSAANSGTTSLIFGLISPSETDGNQWKRFDTNPKLIVTYNFPPSGPTASGLTSATSCNGRIYTGDNTPTLNGHAHDNNDPHTALALRYTVYPAGGSSPRVASGDVAATDNAPSPWSVSSVLPDGNWEYTVKAHFASANTYIDIMTGESSRYGFTVQRNPPATAPSLVSADYPPGYWGAAVSHHGSFAVDDNGASNVIGFEYVWDAPGGEATPTCAPTAGKAVAAVGGRATIAVPAGEGVGPHRLSVRSYNNTTGMGPETTYTFYVSPDAGTSGVNRIEAEDASLNWAGSPSQSMTDLYRYLGPGDHATGAGGIAPAGYALDEGLGLISASPQPNTNTLYDCTTSADHFTSTSATCEGKTLYKQLGYIYATQPAGLPTHPIYRCLGSEHFDSYLSTCEGFHLESTLGYALDLPTTGTPQFDDRSSGYGLQFMPATALNQQFSFTITPPVTADYGLGGLFYTGPTNGALTFTLTDDAPRPNTVQLGTDGTPGAPVNTYATSASESYTQLGGAYLQASHTYTITATVSAPGTTGSTNYNAGLDYLTLAPVTDLAAVPNNHGIAAHDNQPTTADLSGSHQALSASALATLGITPGATYKVGQNGPTFRIPDAATDGSDNIISQNQVMNLPLNQPAAATQLNLLVADTGPLTPADNFNYVISTIDNGGNNVAHQLPAIPNWLTADNSTVTSTDTAGGTRSPAGSMTYYDSGTNATPTNAGVYLYLITIPISQTSPLTNIILPANNIPHDPTNYALHVLAVSTS